MKFYEFKKDCEAFPIFKIMCETCVKQSVLDEELSWQDMQELDANLAAERAQTNREYIARCESCKTDFAETEEIIRDLDQEDFNDKLADYQNRKGWL